MNTKASKAPLGATLVVVSSIFYASYGIWTTLMGDFFGGYAASAIRSVFVAALFILLAAVLKRFEPLKLRENGKYLLGMIIASLFIWGPLYYAILTAGIGLSLTVAYASIVIWTFFFGWLWISEKFTKDKMISVALGVTGLALIFLPTSSSFAWLGLGAAVLSGFGSGANTVIVKQIKYNATQSTLMMWLASVIGNVTMALILGQHIPTIGVRIEWVALLAFTIVSLIATWTLVTGLKFIEAGAAGVLGLLEIVFGLAFGAIFFHERPSALALLGSGIIIVAASIPYIRAYQSQRS